MEKPLISTTGSSSTSKNQIGGEHAYRFSAGETIKERFQVIKPLGHGGFAEVYLCQDTQLHRNVAVKVLLVKEGGLEEARASSRLEHPHIVQVHDINNLADGTPILVFRYIDGQTMEKWIDEAQFRRRSLDDTVLNIIRQIAEAIDYANSQGVIHQDIKPSNIILDKRHNAYLTDFGLAALKKPSMAQSMLSTALQSSLRGTIPYMAPEQLKDQAPASDRTDLYSFGVLVYELLTGQLPYRGRDTNLIYQIGTSDPMPPHYANPDLPEGISAVLLRVLDKNPDARHPSCKALADELAAKAKDYVTANSQYAEAQKLFLEKNWREALHAFQALVSKTPGFKDTGHYLEQAQYQVKLLELYEQANKALQQKKFQEALDTLNVLTQLDPHYQVDDLRQQARDGLASATKRTLDEQYQKAVEQFAQREYQACLDTLAIIRSQNPDYLDSQHIEKQSREQVERQQRLRELYTQGLAQMRQEVWSEALETFQLLDRESPRYEDCETRLIMVRHLQRLSNLLQEARALQDQKDFAGCIQKLNDLINVDKDYKQDDVRLLREQAVDSLYDQAKRRFEVDKFEKSLDSLAALRQYAPSYGGLDELEARVREGLRLQDLRVALNALYEKAVECLNKREYQAALDRWEDIQKQQNGIVYQDIQAVERRAKEGLCSNLYNRALAVLAQQNPQQALDLWQQIVAIDPVYPDSQNIQGRAEALRKKQDQLRWWGLGLGAGAILLVIVLVGNWALFGGDGTTPPPTPTKQNTVRVNEQAETAVSITLSTPSPTSTRTATPSITPTPITPTPTHTATATPSPTRTPSATPSATPTATPTPDVTATPEEVTATAVQASSIYAEQDAGSQELDFVGPGETVVVLEQSSNGDWLRVRNSQGIEGFVAANRFTFEKQVVVTASAIENSSIYREASLNAPVLVLVDAGEEVIAIARTADNTWLYIQNSNDVQGFVQASLFVLSADITTLPAIDSPDSSSNIGSSSVNGITLDLWTLPGVARCAGGKWYQTVFMEGHGGNGVYTYFWNGEQKGGPVSNQSITFEVEGQGNATINGRGEVRSGDGQSTWKTLFVAPPGCG